VAGTGGSRLTALGGEVKLTPNTITGEGSTLQAVEGITDEPTIAVGGTLSLKGVNLDLQYGGSLTFTNGNVVRLESGTNPGKLTLGDDDTPYAGVLPLTSLVVHPTPPAVGVTGALSGNGILLGGEDVSFPIGALSGTEKAWLAVTATGNLRLESGSTVTN
jgi:hypothetical protein